MKYEQAATLPGHRELDRSRACSHSGLATFPELMSSICDDANGIKMVVCSGPAAFHVLGNRGCDGGGRGGKDGGGDHATVFLVF